MPRSPKFPGLQLKFEQSLLRVLKSGDSLSGRELLEATRASRVDVDITDPEMEDLERNSANYLGRAKQSGVIESAGPWAGYRLAASAPAEDRDEGLELEAAPPAAEPAGSGGKRRFWESFLHFPATINLSRQFNARVLSLRNASDPVRWGNPDMLMLRASSLDRLSERLGDDDIDAEIFRRVDATPPCILSSIELKFGLDRDRTALFQAIAECAANSRWANESWLVFMDRNQTLERLDDEIVSLARSAEVGILEIRVVSEDGRVQLETEVHQLAQIRTTLRVDEINRRRVDVLKTAQILLSSWDRNPTFMDAEGTGPKFHVLVQQAVENLQTQRGFGRDIAMESALEPLLADDPQIVERVIKGSFAVAMSAAELETADAGTQLRESVDTSLNRRDGEALYAALAPLLARAGLAAP